MPWPTYSERLLRVAGGVGWTGGLVPPGKRAVVNDVSASKPGPNPDRFLLAIAGYVLFEHNFLAASSAVHHELRAVAYAGESIEVFQGAGGIYAYICGFLFDDPVVADEDPLEAHWKGREISTQPADPLTS